MTDGTVEVSGTNDELLDRRHTNDTNCTQIPNSHMWSNKMTIIQAATSADPADISMLRRQAIGKDGLLNDELRTLAWPKLLEVDVNNIPPTPVDDILQKHRDYGQVVLDVNRSLRRFPPGMEDDVRLALQDKLVAMIMRVLVRHEELHYYQGYHDICVTFLLVVGEEISFALLDKLSMLHLRDFMDVNMERTRHMLSYLYPIVGKANPSLRDYMDRAEVGTIFALSWLITWYGHVLSEFRHIVRLYDFFIACHPLMPIYLAASIVLYRSDEILATECEMCYIHSMLSKIPDNLPYEELISIAGDLYIQFPPKDLANEAIMSFNETYEKCRAIPKARRRKVAETTVADSNRNFMIRVTVWTLAAAASAVAVAMLNKAFDIKWWL